MRTWLPRRSLEKVVESLFVDPPLLSVPEFEGNFYVGPRSHLVSRLLINGNYEPLLAELARCLIDSNRDVVDIGANVGFYTVLSARHTRGRVLAIEPTDNALRLLRRNIVHNELVNKVLVFEGVVSDVSGEVTLSFLNGKEEYSSIEVIRHPSVVGVIRSCKTVVSNTLDQLVKQFVLDPGFIKVDVEGAEHKVYMGASEVLSNARPIVLSEFSPRLLRANGADPDDLIRLLRDNGYSLIDPIMPKLEVGRRDYGDLLGVPEERYTDAQLIDIVASAHEKLRQAEIQRRM